jgi:hypothetical protein
VATGAELQCITGFSISNYLTQAYSADLDFGTGDFYVAGWVKNTHTSTGNKYILDRSGPISGVPRIALYRSGLSGNLTFHVYDSSTSITALVACPTAGFFFVVAQKVGTNLELWLNGVLVDTEDASSLGSVSNVTSTLYVGTANIRTTPWNDSLALLRIGAGSLTEAQIAEMYRTELPLFQPNAKCTLQGTSNDVKGLAYDDRYNLLAATHGDKVTIFRDLEVEDVIDLDPATGVAVDINNKGVLIGTSADAQWENGG